MTDDDVLRKLRDLATRLGKAALTVDEVEEHLPFSGETLRRRWGGSRAAFGSAGFSATSLGRRYTDNECFENMLTVWTHYGRPPKYHEMRLTPSRGGGKAYVQRFGTWNKALAAFIERANREADASAEPAAATAAQGEKPRVPPDRTQRRIKNGRDIPLGCGSKCFGETCSNASFAATIRHAIPRACCT